MPAGKMLARTHIRKLHQIEWSQNQGHGRKGNSDDSAADVGQIVHGFCEFVSQRKRGLSPVELTCPFGIWGICFPHCDDFSLVSSCWNLITPFSNNVNIVRLLFFSSLLRGDSLFLSEEAHTLSKTSGQIQRDGGIHSQQKLSVICFKTLNRDLGKFSERPLNSSLAENYVLKSLKQGFVCIV